MTKSDVQNMIDCMMRGEAENYAEYMKNNPGDEQRKHDHMIINSVYVHVLNNLDMLFRNE